MATGILATGISVGIVLGFGVTPLFVSDAADIPRMGWVWFVPTAFACAFTYAVFLFNGSRPPSPPSRSADVKEDKEADAANEVGYWRRYAHYATVCALMSARAGASLTLRHNFSHSCQLKESSHQWAICNHRSDDRRSGRFLQLYADHAATIHVFEGIHQRIFWLVRLTLHRHV